MPMIRSHALPGPANLPAGVASGQTRFTARQGISRAAFLRGGLAATAAAASSRFLGSPAIAAEPIGAEATISPALSPLDLEFSIVEQFRPFDLLPRRFAQVREWFGSAGAADRYKAAALQAGGNPASIAPTPRGALQLRSVGAAPTLFPTASGPAAPFATVIVSTGSTAEPAATRQAAVMAGLVRDARNHVMTSFDAGADPTRGTVAIDVVVDGQSTRAAVGTADFTGSVRFAFVVNENHVTALIGDAAGWRPVVQSRITKDVDLRDPAVLSQYRYGFGVSGENAQLDIAGLEAGYFGQAGLRDLHVVSWADGTPYIKDRQLYFTATQAGLAFFETAHWGVWTLDLDDPSRIEQVANLFFARDGVVLGDHAGHIVVDDQDGGFHVAVSGWGDFAFKGVRIHYVRTSEDILQGVHVLKTAPMPLPTDMDSWDPAMVRIGDRWHVGFVESPDQDPVAGFDFHPALARGEAGDPLTRLRRVGADLTRKQTEGIILQKIGGRWYLLASDGDERRYRVYDLSMQLLGFLRAPYGTNIPHPQIVPILEGERTHYLMLTFNGTQYHEPLLGYGTHGDVIVMDAAQTVQGHEFPPRHP